MKKYIIALGVIASLAFTASVSANSSFFLPVQATAAASSTVTYMTPGISTTTYAYDAFQGGQYKPLDKNALLIQFSASSTSSILNWQYEYSPGNGATDCTVVNANCDWYGDSINDDNGTTTSAVRNVAPFQTYTWTFASTTVGTSVSGRVNKIVSVPATARYVRVLFSVTGANGGVWAQFLPQREAQ